MAKTKTLGFYNPHTYPILIAELNRSLPPGKFISNDAGQKVNDPYFDKFVRSSGGLAREISQEEVDVIYYREPQPQPTEVNRPGFSGYAGAPIRDNRFGNSEGMPLASKHVLEGYTGRPEEKPIKTNDQIGGYKVNEAAVVVGIKPNADNVKPGERNPVSGMSMEEARRRKIIKDARPLADNFGPEDSATLVVPPEAILPMVDLPPQPTLEEFKAGIIELPQPLLDAPEVVVEGFRAPDGKVFKKRPAFVKYLEKNYNAREIETILERYPDEKKIKL